MINISLIPDSPIWVQVSVKPTTATRIGEIVLLPNEAQTTDDVFTSRPPWESLVVANEWSIRTGMYIRSDIYNKVSGDAIFVTSQSWDINQISKLDKQELMLSFIQKNDNNGFQAAICSNSYLEGVKIVSNEISLAFGINRSEMLYNR